MIVIGVDTHKRSHTLVALDAATGGVRGQLLIPASDEGTLDALRFAAELDSERVWAVEDCRHVSGRLERGLVASGDPVVRVVPGLTESSRRATREPGKSDPIDATAIARAALREGIDTLPVAFLDEQGVAYGGGGGALPGLLLDSPRDEAGNLIMIGSGRQHWSTVHVADLADFFRRVLEDDTARGYYVVGDGLNPAVAELTEAAAVAVGAPGAVPGSDEEARARLGDYFAEVVLLDQGTVAAKARDWLGWHPMHPGLVDELREGSYRKVTAG